MKKEILMNYIFVIKQISYKEHKRKIDETNLGIIWNVLNPFIYMLILSVYYENVILHDIPNFPVFVFVGIIIFNYFRSSTTGAMKSLVNNKTLLTKTKLPILVFVIQKTFSAFKELLYGMIALVPVMFFFKIPISSRIYQLLPLLIILTIIVSEVGIILAILYVLFADIDYLYGVFMTMMVFVSGVFVPIDHLPIQLQNLMEYNPIFLCIYISRNSIIYDLPSHWSAWVKLLIWGVVLFVVTIKIYKSQRDKCINKL